MAKARGGSKKGPRYGVIRPDGSWVFEPRYAQLGIYNDGRAAFSDDGKRWGFADERGEPVIPASYSYAFNFVSGAASVEHDFVVENGSVVRDRTFDVIDREGKSLALWRGATREGRVRACTGRSSRAGGVQAIWDPGMVLGNKWGFLDEHAAAIVEPTYSYALDFMEGLACVHADDGTRYLDRDGKVAIGPLEGSGRGFSNGRARIKRPDGRWYFIDKTGTVVLDTPYVDMEPFRDERAQIKVDGVFGFIDLAGNVITAPTYVQTRPFAGGMAAVAVLPDPARPYALRWGFIDASGSEAIAPAFASVGDFHGGVAPASIYPEGKNYTLAGLIDRSGAWVVEPTYKMIGNFVDGVAPFAHFLAGVTGHGKEGLLDPTGAIVADGYTRIDTSGGFPAPVAKGGKVSTRDFSISGAGWGFVDATGKEVIACELGGVASGFSTGFGFATVAG